MADNNSRNDWGIFGAVALIVLGVWLLLGRLPWWDSVREAFEWVFSLGWPLALIILGIVLLMANRRGGQASGQTRRLYRSRSQRMVGGVLGGLAEYLGTDPTWLRIAFAVLAVLSGAGPAILAYLIAMIVIPEAPVAAVQPPVWPGQQSSGWAQPAGTETVQSPPPVPPVPAPPVPPVPDPYQPPAPPKTPGS